MTRIVFSRAAEDDRRAITEFTVEHYGIAQARKLRRHLETSMKLLAGMPSSGRRWEELDPPGKAFRYRTIQDRFVIVYEPADDGIRIVRILHGARNLACELAGHPGTDR